MTTLTHYAQDGLEIYIDHETGESFASAKGYSRMANVEYDTIKKRCQRGGCDQAEIPTEQGIRWGTLVTEDLIAEWLPKDNPAAATQLLKLGVRLFMHKLAGYEHKAAQPQLPTSYLDALKALVQSEEEKLALSLKAQEQAAIIEELQPKAEIYEQLCENYEGTFDLGTASKVMGFKDLGQKRLFAKLREMNIIFGRNNIPYQEFMERGYFIVKETHSPNGRHVAFQPRLTQRGLNWLTAKLKEWGYKPQEA
ncbi:hypothetical protein CLI64_11150 [Nostoc sp. CENA543]|uniref:phage antirepressor KilAC domain-containing protein n=1 Tax=Nostoc sp. CENA543 TaxID=1869241 RepID=UPI000CA16E5D|nr:phage antirepressor KilAC domain-containing protein [Nostoc sp. CENA543]AUT00911.1 hypothetical protein CLI64_11150 [Nostoc sp. CENA543]